MKYQIEYIDNLYCVFKAERLGQMIVAAFETKKEAIEYIEKKGGKQ